MRSFDFYQSVWWLLAEGPVDSLKESAREILKNLPTKDLIILSETFLKETEEERGEMFKSILRKFSEQQLQTIRKKLSKRDVVLN